MMAWGYFVVPLGTSYEAYFQNCSLPYFTEFVIINNSHLEVNTTSNGSTECSLPVTIAGFDKARQRQAKDQLKKLALKLQVLCHLHAFMHSQRKTQSHTSSLLISHIKRTWVPGWKGTVVCPCQDSVQMTKRSWFWGIPMHSSTLYVVLVWSSDSQKYFV